MGVTTKSIRYWIKKLNPKSLNKASESGKTMQELESENRRLRKKIEYINKINEVLKKSTAIFSVKEGSPL